MDNNNQNIFSNQIKKLTKKKYIYQNIHIGFPALGGLTIIEHINMTIKYIT